MGKKYKYILLLFLLLCSLKSLAIDIYSVNYKIDKDTIIGKLEIGEVQFKLEIDKENNSYRLFNEIKPSSNLLLLLKYSRIEESYGDFINNEIINTNYKLYEYRNNADVVDVVINIFYDQKYLTINEDKIITDGDKIIDYLSLYPILYQDINTNPEKKSFVYKIANKDGIKEVNFKHIEDKKINFNEEELQATNFYSEESKISLSFVDKYKYFPVSAIQKTNKYKIYLTMKDYKIN